MLAESSYNNGNRACLAQHAMGIKPCCSSTILRIHSHPLLTDSPTSWWHVNITSSIVVGGSSAFPSKIRQHSLAPFFLRKVVANSPTLILQNTLMPFFMVEFVFYKVNVFIKIKLIKITIYCSFFIFFPCFFF